MRNSKGQFMKGSKPINGFKKGVIPNTAFKKGNAPWNKVSVIEEKKCLVCEKVFKNIPRVSTNSFLKRKYCSRTCMGNDPDIKQKFIKLMSVPFSPERKARHKNAFKRGTESHRWIQDRTKLKIGRSKAYDTKYKYWMLEVKKRDGWKCKISNDGCSGRLEAHHILNWNDYPELRYQINNGITLCQAHHPRGRTKEKRLESYFMELVSVSKV